MRYVQLMTKEVYKSVYVCIYVFAVLIDGLWSYARYNRPDTPNRSMPGLDFHTPVIQSANRGEVQRWNRHR
jgi:hypothetical protein